MKLILQTVPAPIVPDMTLNPAQLIARRQLLDRGRSVETVTDAATQTDAVAVGRDIRSYVKSVSEARKTTTAPLDEAKAKVMDLERELLGPLQEEQRRLERLVADFQNQEQRRIEAAESAKRAEVEHLEQERMEAEEVARKAAARMSTEKGLVKAVEAEQRAQAAEAAVQAAVRERPATAARSSGMAVKRDTVYRVMDVKALYAAHPELCILEPKPSAIRATCFPRQDATESKPDTTTIPGLSLWWEMRATLRAR